MDMIITGLWDPLCCFALLSSNHRQTERYLIDRKKVNPDLFVIEIREICTSIYNIVNLLKSYDNIHSMIYITKIMLTGIAIKNHWVLR